MLLTLALATAVAATIDAQHALPQTAGTPPASLTPASVSEATPVAVPPATPTALRYYTSGNRLWVLDQVVSIALLAAILFSGMSARLRTWAQRIGRNWFFTIVVYFALFTIVTFVITLPLTYYEEFVRQHDYGLSNQTLQKWWTDSLTALAVTCVAGGLFLWVPYLLLRKSPRRWWLYTAAAAIPFIVVANLVAPIWIAPLFNSSSRCTTRRWRRGSSRWRIVRASKAVACSRSTRASIPRR